jgi:predicted nucleotidyltransferase
MGFADAIRLPRPSDALAVHRGAIRDIALESGARDVLLFGSTGRGTDLGGSDLDLLLIDPPTALSGFTLVRLERRIAHLTGVPVQLLTIGDLPAAMCTRVLAEARSL